MKNVNSCCLEMVRILLEERHRKQRKVNIKKKKNNQIGLMFVIVRILGIQEKIDLDQRKNRDFIFR